MMLEKLRQSLKGRPLKQLTVGKRKTGGRNSSGRITAFHIGGGAKQSLRNIDMKRNTPGIGIVERIEYDPNRSARIALIRWKGLLPSSQREDTKTEDVVQASKMLNLPHKKLELPSATMFPLSIFPQERNILPETQNLRMPCAPCKHDLPTIVPPSSKSHSRTPVSKSIRATDLFLWNFYKGETRSQSLSHASLLGLPKIALAGAKPAFFALRTRDAKNEFDLCDIQRTNYGADKLERKDALSWHSIKQQEEEIQALVGLKQKADKGSLKANPIPKWQNEGKSAFSYILASQQLEVGNIVMNCESSQPSSEKSSLQPGQNAPAPASQQFLDLVRAVNLEVGSKLGDSKYALLDLASQVGNCVQLSSISMGTWIHNVEERPGQGGKLARSAGTSAKIVKEIKIPGKTHKCVVRLPSGAEKMIDARCRATIGLVSNPSHGARKLKKAGNNRWRGIRPTVRGVAMNPIDHPHGGGEGKSKGRPSVSPWGKPTKAGYRSPSVVKRKRLNSLKVLKALKSP